MRFASLMSAALIVAAQVAPGSRDAAEPSALQLRAPAANAPKDAIRRGRYLVRHVAMCVECHTPRRADGSLDEDRLLTGAPIPVQSPFPARPWAFTAPPLAGLPGGWTDEDLTSFLQTGKTPNGYAPKPPMPGFRMNRDDASAVASYLKSLRHVAQTQ